MASNTLQVRVVSAIADVPAEAWNTCANPAAPEPTADVASRSTVTGAREIANTSTLTGPPQALNQLQHTEINPFISHEFLHVLETSHSATARAGWQPQHLVAETPEGVLAGVAPCYLKSHSRGEYVFDQGWADAYERAGGDYYPKLQVAVPFTPVTGRRLMVAPGFDPETIRTGLAAALVELCQMRHASSAHVTFATKEEWRALGDSGFLQRNDQQFHWENQGYKSFEDFLAQLAARKRKAIKRERRDALESGITLDWLTGADITEAAWDAFFAFYMDTGSRKWGRPYLTREFFSLIGQTMRDRILLVMAKRAGRWIAGAINFIGSHTLYGRHWGAIEHHPFLHFEVCYYQAIEFAITRGLRVEAGAQGEHKLARGYMPVRTYSAHYIADPALRRAIGDYLRRERAYVAAAGDELAAFSPFRKDLVPDET
jgi:predicted N-acyltransferase